MLKKAIKHATCKTSAAMAKSRLGPGTNDQCRSQDVQGRSHDAQLHRQQSHSLLAIDSQRAQDQEHMQSEEVLGIQTNQTHKAQQTQQPHIQGSVGPLHSQAHVSYLQGPPLNKSPLQQPATPHTQSPP